MPTATKAYQGLIINFISTGTNGDISLNRICRSAGLGPSTSPTRDGTINYYLNGSDAGQIVSNDLKGVGPFILASVEYEIMNTLTDLKTITVSSESDFNIIKYKGDSTLCAYKYTDQRTTDFASAVFSVFYKK